MSSIRVFYISPHPDDVAFSCFVAIRNSIASSEAAHLITIFSESDWTAQLGFVPELKDSISMLRRREDMAFTARLRCERTEFFLPDSNVRGYSERKRYTSEPRFDPIMSQINEKIEDLMSDIGAPDRVFLPLGLGNHIDHLLTRNLCRDRFPNHSEISFYEDLPYAFGIEEDDIFLVAESIKLHLQPVLTDLSALWAEKSEAIRTYRSQLGHSTLERIASYAHRISPNRGMAERYWTPRRRTMDRS